MPSSWPETTFAEATAVTPLSSHTYECYFPDDWCIGTVPHGGYITSVFLQVASKHFSTTLSSQNQPHTIALHLDFLRRTQVGPALFTIRDIKLGRQASVIQITLTQGSREEVTGTITQSNMHTETGVSFPTSYTLTPPPLPVNLSLLSLDQDPNWVLVPSMPYASFRKATTKATFSFPRSGQQKPSSADEWIRSSSSTDKWTNASLGFICDMWPMPVESFLHQEKIYDYSTITNPKKHVLGKAKFWYPTLLLNLDVKKVLPEEGVEWLFVRVDTKVIRNGRMDLDVVILDEAGEVVALSHHVAFAVSAGRNVAERKTEESKI